MKPRLLVSFSGGRTSAYMSWLLKAQHSDQYDMRFVFANTGIENEATLKFVDRCDKAWGLGVVWVEAVVNPGRVGCTHVVVDFTTASRKGEPFEAVIEKYGIPNQTYKHCTRELKLNPINSWARSIGWDTGMYITAVGIRADEPRRPQASGSVVHPLRTWFPTTKPEVNDFWAAQDFDLGLQDYEGNCVTCFKKSDAKLIRIATERPGAFDFFRRMESQQHGSRKRFFFRGYRSCDDILELARSGIAPTFDTDPDADSGCSESCEATADD